MIVEGIATAAEVTSEVAAAAEDIDLISVAADAENIANEIWPVVKEDTAAVESEITPETIADEAWEDALAEKLQWEIETAVQDYIDDLKDRSDVKDTLEDEPFDVSDLEPISPGKNAEMREEFDFKKNALKRQWEETYQRPWPKYESDVYITNANGDKVLIRKAGMDYDAHHIQPLSLGGKNDAANITPLRADEHFDHKGIHQAGSPYDQMSKILGEIDL